MLADFPYRARFFSTSGRQMNNNRNIGRLENFKRNALFAVTPLCYISLKCDNVTGQEYDCQQNGAICVLLLSLPRGSVYD